RAASRNGAGQQNHSLISTTPAARAKVASQLFLCRAATPPRLRRGIFLHLWKQRPNGFRSGFYRRVSISNAERMARSFFVRPNHIGCARAASVNTSSDGPQRNPTTFFLPSARAISGGRSHGPKR